MYQPEHSGFNVSSALTAIVELDEMRRVTLIVLVIGLLLMGAGAASAQNYPNKPVRMVTAEVGAAGDRVSRSIAPQLSERFGQPVIVENRGGSGVIPIETVAKALPD